MDMEITIMVEAFVLFVDYGIFVTHEDALQIDNLRFNFDKMIENVSKSILQIF